MEVDQEEYPLYPKGYVPYVSLDPLNDPKSFTFRIKVCNNYASGTKIFIFFFRSVT